MDSPAFKASAMCGSCVVGQRMRQDDGVHRGVRQVERTPKRMTQLVVQAHAHLTQHRTTQPGPVERIAPGFQVVRIGSDARQYLGYCP